MQPLRQLGYLLHHLSFVIDRQSDQVLQERLGIGFSQFKILMCIGHDSISQQRRIADKLGQTESSVSRQIKLMHDKGLLTSKVSPKNRREHITTLTAKGEKLVEKAFAVLEQEHAPVFESLSGRQLEELQKTINVMHHATCRGENKGCDLSQL